MPKSRIKFWQKKFDANIKRDECVQKELTGKKIKVLIVWECTIKRMKKDKKTEEEVISLIEKFLLSSEFELEI